jgi:predicted dehydrogenase
MQLYSLYFSLVISFSQIVYASTATLSCVEINNLCTSCPDTALRKDELKFLESITPPEKPVLTFAPNSDAPREWQGVHANKNIVVLGSQSDLARGLTGWVKVVEILKYLTKKTGIYDFDPKLNDPKSGQNPLRGEIKLENYANEMPPNAHVVLLTPNRFHVPQIIELSQHPNVAAIYCEKPAGLTTSDMQKLLLLSHQKKKPVVLGDHEYLVMAPIYRLLNTKNPFANYAQISDDPQGKIAQHFRSGTPILGPITRVEGVHRELGNIENRHGLRVKGQGGVILDLGVHFFNALSLIDLVPSSYRNVALSENANGKFIPLTKDSANAEDLAVMSGQMSNGAEFSFELQQFSPKRESWLSLSDDRNNYVILDRDHRVAKVFKGGEYIGAINQPVGVYHGMMNHFLTHARDDDNIQLVRHHTDVINAIEEAKRASGSY